MPSPRHHVFKDTAGAARALSCGVPNRDSNETKFLQEAPDMIDDYQRRSSRRGSAGQGAWKLCGSSKRRSNQLTKDTAAATHAQSWGVPDRVKRSPLSTTSAPPVKNEMNPRILLPTALSVTPKNSTELMGERHAASETLSGLSLSVCLLCLCFVFFESAWSAC